MTETQNDNVSSFKDKESPSLTSQQKRLIRQKINTAYLKAQQEYFNRSFSNERKYLLQKFSMEKPDAIEIAPSDSPINSSDRNRKNYSVTKET